ncbi:MAG: ROK family protein, partial [Brachybacterium sp.]|nr:ROK family protein [Brachybacterium sp.]
MTAARWAVGVDVGGTRTKIGAISPAGALAVPHSLPTPTEPGDLAALIGREVDSLGRHLDLPEGSPVGVVVPGILDEAEEQIERAVNLGWTDIPFGRML